VPEFVVGPRKMQRPADSWSTALGAFGQPELGRVDAGGLVSPSGVDWSIDWWVHIDNTWTVPAFEPAVRQSRVGSGPVIETALRAGSSDIRHRAYAVVIGGQPAIAIEIHNDRDDPIAVGLGLRPYGPNGDGGVIKGPVGLDDKVIRVGNAPVLVLPRSPSQAGLSNEQDLLATLQAGQQLSWDQRTNSEHTNAAVVLPVGHKSSMRFLIPVGDETEIGYLAGADPRSSPDSDMVARGWESLVNSGSQFNFPDPAVTSLFGAARARLLTASNKLGDALTAAADGSGGLLDGLSMGGYHAEVSAGLRSFAQMGPTRFKADPRQAAEIVAALATALSVTTTDADVVSTVIELAMRWTKQVDKSGDRDTIDIARTGLGRLAYLAGDHQGALNVMPSMPGGGLPSRSDSFDILTDLVSQSSPVGGWGDDDAASAARFVAAGRSMVVDDSGVGDRLALLPYFPAGWRGGNAEYVGVGVFPSGTVSYAIRWHGARPALLWDTAGSATQSSITCPGLDPDWEADSPKGDALLAGASESLPAPAKPGESFI